MPDATFVCSDLTTLCRLDELGLKVVGQRLLPERAVLACRTTEGDEWCRRCSYQGVARDSVTRRLAHEPLRGSDRGGEPDPRLRTFGSRLRRLREERGLTLEPLAHEAQIGVRQLARVEAGRASPILLWIIGVAEGLGLEPWVRLKPN